MQEQRSVFSSLDGDQHSLQQQMEQGQNTANALDLASTDTNHRAVSKNGELVGSVFQQQRGDGTHPLEKVTKVGVIIIIIIVIIIIIIITGGHPQSGCAPAAGGHWRPGGGQDQRSQEKCEFT